MIKLTIIESCAEMRDASFDSKNGKLGSTCDCASSA
jgi:hypothetical protein